MQSSHEVVGGSIDHNRTGQAACLLLVILQYAFVCHFQISYAKTQKPFDPQDDTAYYFSESAFHYRYAKLAATGRGIPLVDPAAGVPEGTNTTKDLSLIMERTTGILYKSVNRIHPVAFHLFVVYFFAIVSSLSVFVFYFAAYRIGKSPILAVLMTAAFAFNPSSWARFRGEYVYEGFAAPWLFLGFSSILAAIESSPVKKGPLAFYSTLAGISLSIGLMSWHFSRFFALMLLIALNLHYAADMHQDTIRRTLRFVLIMLGACFLVVGIAFPVLRTNAFLTSPAMILVYSFAVAELIQEKLGFSRPRWIGSFLCAVLLGLAFSHILQRGDAFRYSHVYAPVLAKLAHLLKKPADPAGLSTEARMMWVPSLNSPTLGGLFYWGFPITLLFFVAPAQRYRLRFRKVYSSPEGSNYFLLAACLANMASYLLFERMLCLAAFFAAILAFYVVTRNIGRRSWAAALLSLVAIVEMAKTGLGASPANLVFRAARRLSLPATRPVGEFENEKSVIRWITSHTAPRSIFLSGIGFSAEILSYADRPVILHPKFEWAGPRVKYAEFLRALYGKEDALFNLCMKYGADYLIYQASFVLDDSVDGERYAGDALTLLPSAAAYRLHFMPDSLQRFRLVYEDNDFRIFAVLKTTSSAVAAGEFIPFQEAVYDLKEFIGDIRPRELRPGESVKLLDKLSRRRTFFQQAQLYGNHGEYQLAERMLRRVLELFPSDAHAWLEIARLRARAKDLPASLDAAERAAGANPNSVQAYQLLAALVLRAGKMDLAVPVLRRLLAIDPENVDACLNLGVLYLKRNNLRESLHYFSKAHELNPQDTEITRNYGIVSKLLSRSRSF